ncbi:hypothetical protein CRENBAI_019726 [Crenichthys baileyi]|uniref:Uncharacterized protein n=1 Tax=Crenichthys baileyi TaxID=28760 RepID=A0AAV9QWX3_9TELE
MGLHHRGYSSYVQFGRPSSTSRPTHSYRGDLKSKPQAPATLALAPGDLKSKLQSSCNSQPWLQVPALHPDKVKFPGSQGIYLYQVLAESSKPPSSSKRTLLTLHQLTIHHQLQ